MCGNHVLQSPVFRLPVGSPPRVREPPVLSTFDGSESGITPACAGTTFCGSLIVQ